MPKNNKYSDLKIFSFPAKIESFRRGEITAPLYVRIKPINQCMHACHWCVYSDGHTRPKDRPELHLQSHMHETMREHDRIPWPKMQEIIGDLAGIGTKAVTFSGGGEPLMYPQIRAAMQMVHFNGLDLSIITNGQALKGESAELLCGAKWVRVSMDYTCAGQMSASRNVPNKWFGEVLDNMALFAQSKNPTCDLGVNFIVTRDNHADLVPFARHLKDIGVDNIRFSPVYCESFREYHEPIARRVREQLAEMQGFCSDDFTINSSYDLDSASKLPAHAFHRCLYAQTVPVIGADQNVYACHNTAYSKHGLLGSIADRSFRDFWFSEDNRRAQQALCPEHVCRHECANHSKVELFNRLADASSDNFI